MGDEHPCPFHRPKGIFKQTTQMFHRIYGPNLNKRLGQKGWLRFSFYKELNAKFF